MSNQNLTQNPLARNGQISTTATQPDSFHRTICRIHLNDNRILTGWIAIIKQTGGSLFTGGES